MCQKNAKTTYNSKETRVKPKEYKEVGTQLTLPFKEFINQHETANLITSICGRENLLKAWKQVVSKKGCAGIDEMTVKELTSYVQENWDNIKESLLQGTYQFSPVKEILIPKPGKKGHRKLGIPTVMDRFISFAILQVVQKFFDPNFSDQSYGFRPGKSAHQAVHQAQKYIKEGYEYVVDVDLENFFDRINHDKLMSEVAKVIKDKIVLKLLRQFLQKGLLKTGYPKEGVPQGNPLSPLLSNIILNLLDVELERRKHKFCRYADDCKIYTKSKRAAERVLSSITRFVENKLKLKVNKEKSKTEKSHLNNILGFSYYYKRGEVKVRISDKTKKRFKEKIRLLTRASKWSKIESVVGRIRKYCEGWLSYYRINESQTAFNLLESWVRRRLRVSFWRQWKTPKRRQKELMKRGVEEIKARMVSGSSKGPWRISICKTMHKALPNETFTKLGLPKLIIK